MPKNEEFGWDHDHRMIRSFEGDMFVERDGYTGKAIRDDAENIRLASLENHQKHHRSLMSRLTVVLAVGILPAFYLSLADLYWKYCWFQDWFSPSVATIVLIAATIFLLIISLSVYLYPKVKKKA